MAATSTGPPAALAPRGLRDVEEDSLFRRYAEGDITARETIVTRHMPMARRLAARYRNSSQRREDLEQVAYIGLLKAVDRYEPSRGSFVGYAVANIQGEIKRHFRDHGWAIQVPRPLQEGHLAVQGAIETLSKRNGRSPTPRAISELTGFSVERVVEALEAGHAYTVPTLDAPINQTDNETLTLGDTVGAEDSGYANVELGADLGPAFRALPEREQQILHLRFVEDLHQSEIATRVGCSQMHVSRLIRRSLTTLSETMA